MAKKTGLGKGLDALFGGNLLEQNEAIQEENVELGQEIVRNLKLIEVEPNRSQPRRIFDEEALEELAESIKRYGVLQPIIVSKREDYYEIIAGERRWRAAKKAGLSEIPAIIRREEERQRQEIALIENIQREDLNPIERAKGFKVLMEDYNLTQQEVSDALGVSRSTIANSVRILNLDERVIDLALQGKLTEGHCKALLSVNDPDKQLELAKNLIELGDSVRVIEKKTKVRKKMQHKDEKFEAICKDVETSFRDFFGTKVKIDAGERSGKIIIRYGSNEELERLLDLIK